MRVSQYIAEGKISATKVGRGYEIDPNVADRELEGNIDQSQPRPQTKQAAQPPKPISADKPLVADNKKKGATQIVEPLKGGPTYADAQRAREVYRAERERLRLLQEKAELVATSDVRTEASRIARQVRDLLLIIPSRNAARVAAMSDPEDVRALLHVEIESALRGLANA